MSLKAVMGSRGMFRICDTCYFVLTDAGLITEGDRAFSESVIDGLCANCFDYNKPLIDDILGSSE